MVQAVLPLKKVNWATFYQTLKDLSALVDDQRHRDLIVDCSQVEHAYADGMLPLIAELDHRKSKGLRVSLIPPSDDYFFSVFKAAGWLHHISAVDWPEPPTASLQKSLPALAFGDEIEAARVVSMAVKVCMQQLQFGEGAAAALEWILGELSGNVVVHAGGAKGWLQVVSFKKNDEVTISVCDRGPGIPTTMARRFQFQDDTHAIQLALRKGVTSRPDYGQGNGLAGALEVAQLVGGQFSIRSHRGEVRLVNGNLDPRKLTWPFHGTAIEMRLTASKRIDLKDALWGHSAIGIFETEFENDRGMLAFKLQEYSPSFGVRPTGERIRNLIVNLLKANPEQAVEVDFEKVVVIGSSFADECFAKLFLQLGAIEFSRRLRFVRLNSICKALIDRAIVQRIGQESSAMSTE